MRCFAVIVVWIALCGTASAQGYVWSYSSDAPNYNAYVATPWGTSPVYPLGYVRPYPLYSPYDDCCDKYYPRYRPLYRPYRYYREW